MSEDREESGTPPELRAIAESNLENLLPKKSHEIYKKEYVNFERWCNESNVTTVTENYNKKMKVGFGPRLEMKPKLANMKKIKNACHNDQLCEMTLRCIKYTLCNQNRKKLFCSHHFSQMVLISGDSWLGVKLAIGTEK